jgi:hypothetical protein
MLAGGLQVPRFLALSLSADCEFSGSTEWELEMARFASLALGFLLVLLAGAMSRLEKSTSSWVLRLQEDIALWRAEPLVPRARTLNGASVAFVFVYLLSMLGVLAWETRFTDGQVPELFRIVTEENGLYETLTSLMLVTATVYLLRAAAALRRRTPRHPWLSVAAPVGLGALFFVAAGEELSWGQHHLGFATPSSMREVNVQNEFNLHNVGGYWANNALILFFFGFAGVLPWAAHRFWDLAYVCARLHMPIGSVALTPFALISVIFDEREPFGSLFGHPFWRLSEIREALFAAVMLAVCCEFWRRFGSVRMLAEPSVARPGEGAESLVNARAKM